jgi:glycosyltransferase involved in cell wall biosynthesis
MTPRVSVVLPVRDAALTLNRALESIHHQTFRDWECHIVDDGSEDDSVHIVETWLERDPRFRLHRTDGAGLVAALQEGCAAARSELIARMDADDVSHVERFAKQVALLDSRPEIALCGCRVQDIGAEVGDGRRRYSEWMNALLEPADLAREMFIECPVAHPTFMMRRAVLEAAGGYRHTDGPEDYDLVLRLWLAGHALANVGGEPLLAWRDWPGRLSRTDRRYREEAFIRCKREALVAALRRGRFGNVQRLLQWGAGRIGKLWLRTWPHDLVTARAFDINPRLFGRVIHGVPVVDARTIAAPRDGDFLVLIIPAPEARGHLRETLARRGWTEGTNWLFLC